MKLNNKQYWQMRADSRMDNYLASAIDTANTINRSYNDLRRYVQDEINSILRNMSPDTAAYEWRMKRLNVLLAKTEKHLKDAYGLNNTQTTQFLKSIIPEAYYHTIFDISQISGVMPVFAPVNERLISTILRDKWSGEQYSKRIWRNNKLLEKELKQVLTTAAMTGESIYKTANRLNAVFNTSAYNVQRIIRTETTYACNQAELQSYAALDIERYEYVATLDTRTSPQCRELDGKIFPLSKAQAGTNLPPMHPNCRSTTIPYFEDGRPKFRTARDKDGNRIQVPASMKYDEWYQKYIDPNHKIPKTKSLDETKLELTNRKKERMRLREEQATSNDLTARRKERMQSRQQKNNTVEPFNASIFENMNKTQLQKWAVDNLKTPIDFSSGTNSDFIREAVKVIAEFENKMGGNTIEGLKIVFGNVRGRDYASYNPKTKIISLKKTGSMKSFIESQEKINEKALWKTGKKQYATTTYSGTLWHEIGHAVDHDMDQNLSRALSQSESLDKSSIKISRYAGSQAAIGSPKRSEAWAENFAAYMDSKTDDVPDEIANMIEEYFKKKRNI